MPAIAASGVALQTSVALRSCNKLWEPLQLAMKDRLPWEAMDECLPPPVLIQGNNAPWAYLQSDFSYASHRTLCNSERGPYATEPDKVGTRAPAVFIFVETCNAASALGQGQANALREWVTGSALPFVRSRLIIIVCGVKPTSVVIDAACVFAECLVQSGVELVEVRDAEHAADYVVQCALSSSESRKRKAPSRFKVPGNRCQTLPRDPSDKARITWISQLMQVPGVSEEIAKAICSRHPTPAELLKAVASVVSNRHEADGEEVSPASAGAFLANLEIPIRGKNGTRRLGEVVSRRIFELFHPTATPDHLLT